MVGEQLMNLEAIKTFSAAMLSGADPDDVDGLDPEFIQIIAPLVDSLNRMYFRMEIEGMDSVPKGPALVVGNHNAGITFLEPIGISARWYLEKGYSDTLHYLVHDAMLAMPMLRTMLIRMGAVRASHGNANKLLALGKKVVVFPGGNLEAFRPYRDRYRVNFGGKKGFIRLALRERVPIIPVVLVGGHESFFVLHDGARLAKLLHMKKLVRAETFPLFLGLPWGIAMGPLFHLPLPAKSQVRFLDPIPLDQYTATDVNNEQALDEIYQRVITTMQEAVTELAAKRKYPIIG